MVKDKIFVFLMLGLIFVALVGAHGEETETYERHHEHHQRMIFGDNDFFKFAWVFCILLFVFLILLIIWLIRQLYYKKSRGKR